MNKQMAAVLGRINAVKGRLAGSLLARSLTFGYSNARVKAMRASLLPREAIGQMIDADKVADIIGMLERTDYKADFSEPALKYSGADLVEFALGRHLVRKARKVLSFTPKEAVPAVLSVLEKWDAYNLKTILLAKHLGHSNDDIKPFLVPAGVFTMNELNVILERGNAMEIASFLSETSYGAELQPLLNDYKKSKNIQPLLNALEKHFYAKLSRSISPHTADGSRILELVRADIDNRNIMIILRGKGSGVSEAEIKPYLVEGGTLETKELAKLLRSKTADDAVKLVGERFGLEKAAELYKSTKSLVGIEIGLERRVASMGLKALRHSMLSPGALVGYLYLKEAEITNIRKIVRGKEFSVPAEELREAVMLAS